jgi:peroxiredoxin Q/BCP
MRAWHTVLAITAATLIFATGGRASDGTASVGEAAPEFRLQDQNGKWHTLADHKGQWVALYFYPKDQTPGCTKEACAFRDNVFAFEKLGAVVLGVSLDDVKSHEEFARKYSLPFPLLADVDGTVARQYGVLNSILGMKLAKRESFLIDPAGRIVKHYEKVDPEKHSADVLAELQALIAARKGA